MKIISIQIQFQRVPKLNKNKVMTLFYELFINTKQILEMKIDRGKDRQYINISYKTSNVKVLWERMQRELFNNQAIGVGLQSSLIVVCEGKNSWKDYRTLYHYEEKRTFQRKRVKEKRTFPNVPGSD